MVVVSSPVSHRPAYKIRRLLVDGRSRRSAGIRFGALIASSWYPHRCCRCCVFPPHGPRGLGPAFGRAAAFFASVPAATRVKVTVNLNSDRYIERSASASAAAHPRVLSRSLFSERPRVRRAPLACRCAYRRQAIRFALCSFARNGWRVHEKRSTATTAGSDGRRRRRLPRS